MSIPKVQLEIAGRLLRERRTSAAITLRSVAAAASVDPMTVLRVERGLIGRVATISKITEAITTLAAARQQKIETYERHLAEAIQLHAEASQ